MKKGKKKKKKKPKMALAKQGLVKEKRYNQILVLNEIFSHL